MNNKQAASRRRAKAEVQGSDQRDRWLISYADLATLLLALFIVLYAAADHDRATRIASAFATQFSANANPPASGSGVLPGSDSLNEATTAIDRAFTENRTLRDRARVIKTERGLSVSLTEAGFFAPADATIRSDAVPLLDALAEALSKSKAPVRVEGHTDSSPISTSRYPSNWELSAARAATVLSRLEQSGIPASRLSVAGFAGERPVGDNSTPEGRALNRRVDLVILKDQQ